MVAGHIAGVGAYELAALDLGELTVPKDTLMGGRTLPVQAFLLAHPDGLLLFDTGLGDVHEAFDSKLAPIVRRPLADALTAVSVKPNDIAAVVNCHLHYDHCGGNPLLPDIPIFVQAADYNAGSDIGWYIPARIDFPGADLRIFDGEQAIFRGVRAVPTPGHTPGHQSLVIEDSVAPVLLAGQAAYTAAEFADAEAEPARGANTAWDRAHFLKSIAYLRSLKPGRVYFSHDMVCWEP